MTIQETRQWLRGPMVAVATPFTEDYALDLSAFRENIEFIIEHGVRTGQGVLLAGGAGGEFPTLDLEERKQVLAMAVRTARGRTPVMTSVQHTDTRTIVELARFAADTGCHGIQVSPPYYYPSTEDDVFRLFELVANSANVPIMIYNNWWGGFNFQLSLLERLAQLDRVVALKWSAPNGLDFTQGLSEMGGRLVVIDNEGQHVWSHLLGAAGFVTHISNFWPEYPAEVYRLLEQRDYARVTRRLAEFKWDWTKFRSEVERTTGGEGPFIKAGMIAVGLRAGPPRPPACPVSTGTIADLRRMFQERGVPLLN